MSKAIAAILALPGLVCLAGCDQQASAERSVSVQAVASQDHSLEVRYQLDPVRQRVWWLTRDGLYLHEVSKPQRIELALPGWVWAGAPYGCMPDLTLGAHGEAVVTSDVVPTLWKIDPVALTVSIHPLELETDREKDVGFSRIVHSAEHGAFFGVSGMHGSLWKIDPSLTQARKIDFAAARHAAYARSAPCADLSWQLSKLSPLRGR